MILPRLVLNRDELRDLLDELNDRGDEPTLAGVEHIELSAKDSISRAFLCGLMGPYAEVEWVVSQHPHDNEISWESPSCEECGVSSDIRLIDSLNYPVIVLFDSPARKSRESRAGVGEIHKATDGPGPIKSLCEPGWYQLAQKWDRVTCQACLAKRPPEETP